MAAGPNHVDGSMILTHRSVCVCVFPPSILYLTQRQSQQFLFCIEVQKSALVIMAMIRGFSVGGLLHQVIEGHRNKGECGFDVSSDVAGSGSVDHGP